LVDIVRLHNVPFRVLKTVVPEDDPVTAGPVPEAPRVRGIAAAGVQSTRGKRS